jgi:hypothetical protein
MLEIAHTDAAVFPPTMIYNEGWMLRIVLSFQFEGVRCLPFSVRPGARWFSEALIASPFLPRRRGDPLAESHTHLDGVIGHFDFYPGTKAGLALWPNVTQFVVAEAKMFSQLSKGTTNAPYYNQAARNVGCIAWAIALSGRTVSDFESLGFYVLAPAEQISSGAFESQIRKSRIKKKIERRICAYSEDSKKSDELKRWHTEFLIPVLDQIDIQSISWEASLDLIDDASIHTFYDCCLKFNAKPQS